MEEQRLIYNANMMIEECQLSGSEWGVQYWTGVLNYILKKYNKLN
jgi:hypothetical protein|tara:strand:+ start:2995 stop:3129 length:135 start_codon:yes stop_codon:yes gene_type:complete